MTPAKINALFARNLRTARHMAGLSQEQLGEAAGMHRTYISNVELSRVNISLKNIGDLAKALHTTPAALLCEEGFGPHDLLLTMDTGGETLEIPVRASEASITLRPV